MNPLNIIPLERPEIMVDIEALGKRPGVAIFELGAVAFLRSSGEIVSEFHRHIEPHPLATADLETLDWHRDHGTWPRPSGLEKVHLGAALSSFNSWTETFAPQFFWAWGAAYDFAHLDAVYSAERIDVPWRFTRCLCARTIWKVAFPTGQATEKPHSALEDARISVGDLVRALKGIGAMV